MSTTGAAAAQNRKVKVATIGCGGRSNRDITNFIKACAMLGLEAQGSRFVYAPWALNRVRVSQSNELSVVMSEVEIVFPQ